MKNASIKAPSLTLEKKAVAKATSLKSMLVSFQIEGVKFSPKQIESIKSRAHISE
jgi:hypothetical protein